MSGSEKTIEQKTLEGGRSYVVISVISQAISWLFTFWVIRILNPVDYGLMVMASFMTLFVQVFGNLGLGAGIVQRKEVTHTDLSSVFWFSILMGCGLSVLAYFLAYPNSLIFENKDLIPITQLSAIVFLVTSVATVPQSILNRNYRFKDVAKVNMLAAFVSSVASVIFAYAGFGVYTLILTTIILHIIKSIGFLYKSEWRPDLYFNFIVVKDFLKFGVLLSFADAFTRFLQQMDMLIIGRLFSALQLGYYSTAISISNMPIDKISPLINPVVLPMFSRKQDDKENLANVYTKILTYYLMIISPIYIGGFMIAEDLIYIFLGEKWSAMAFILEAFCIINLIKVFSSFHKILLIAKGKARSILTYDIIMFVVLVPSIYYAAIHKFEYVVNAWLIGLPIITIAWLLYGLKKYEIGYKRYLRAIFSGLLASCVMGLLMQAGQILFLPEPELRKMDIFYLLAQMAFAALAYILVVYYLQRDLLTKAVSTLLKK